MAESAQQYTDTNAFPTFSSKADFMQAFEEAINQEGASQSALYHVLFRLSNTDTDNWTSDSDVRHDA